LLVKTRAPARVGWVFRLSAHCNPDDQQSLEEEVADLIGKLIDHCNIYAFQLESAPDTGYLHYQGYFELEKKQRYEWIQTHITHFEYINQRRGTPKQAWDYATKQSTRVAGPYTFGEPTQAEGGAQKTTELFVRAAKEGKSDWELLEEYPTTFARCYKVIDRIRGISRPTRDHPLEVFLFYGPPGTGKTQFAYDQGRLAGYDPYELPIGKDFWVSPKIHQQKWIIIDEFKSNLQLKDLLKLLDQRPIEVPMKGGFQWWCPDVIVITTNKSPWDWYQYNSRDYEREALFRRIETGGAYFFKKNTEKMPIPEAIDLYDESAFHPELDWKIQAQQIRDAPPRADIQFAPGQRYTASLAPALRPQVSSEGRPSFRPQVAYGNSFLNSIAEADKNDYYK